jgi:hypothetical protein
MQLFHEFPVRSAVFDDPGFVSQAGLVPAVAPAARAGPGELTARFLTVPGGAGHAAAAKVTAVVAGMVAGADSIDDQTSSGTAACRCCSPGSGRHRRWARS